MIKEIDILDIRAEIKSGKLTPKVKRGIVYLENDIGECIQICDLKDFGYKNWFECMKDR